MEEKIINQLEAGDMAYDVDKDEYIFLKKYNEKTFELYTYKYGKFIPTHPKFIDRGSPYYNKLKLIKKNAVPQFR